MRKVKVVSPWALAMRNCGHANFRSAQWPQMVSRHIFAKMLLSTLAAPMV